MGKNMLSTKNICRNTKYFIAILLIGFFVLFSTQAHSNETIKVDLSSSLDEEYNSGDYLGVYSNNPYIYIASSNSGLLLYKFDGNKFIFLDSHIQNNENSDYCDVTGYGKYVYTACHKEGLKVYSISAEKLELKDSEYHGGDYYQVTCNENYIFAACYGGGIKAYSYDEKDNLNYITSTDQGGNYLDVHCHGEYVYSCGSDGLGHNGIRIYKFNGEKFSLIDSIKQPEGETTWYREICTGNNGSTIYIADEKNGIKIYSFNGSTLSYVNEENNGDIYLSIECKNNYVFTGSTKSGGCIKQYYYKNNKLNLINETTEKQTCVDLYYNGDYLYAACQKQGVKAFKIEKIINEKNTEYLFDVKVTLSEGRFKEGKNIESLVELLKAEGEGVSEGILTYTIKNKNNEIIWTDKDPSETLLKSTETKVIPTGSLEPGTYTLNIKLEYGDNQTASASKSFQIQKIKTQSIFSNITILFIISSVALLTILLYSNKKKITKILKRKK